MRKNWQTNEHLDKSSIMKQRVIFRADGHPKIGLGHVYRCLTIAEILRKHFNCIFVIRHPLDALLTTISRVCQHTVVLPSSLNPEEEINSFLSCIHPNDIVVLDGYHFTTDYQQAIKDTGVQLLCIDDIFSTHFVADMILNPVGGLSPSHYSANHYTRFYMGPKYALVNPVFIEVKRQKKKRKNSEDIFICLGGADPKNDTLNILKRCENISSIQRCQVVIGAAYQHLKALNDFAQNSRLTIVQHQNLSPSEMANCMQQCATAICSPSSISYEYLTIGGLLYLHQIADNQSHILRYLTRMKLAFNFSEFPIEDEDEQIKTLVLQQKIFDGNSAQNIFQLFKTISHVVPESTH